MKVTICLTLAGAISMTSARVSCLAGQESAPFPVASDAAGSSTPTAAPPSEWPIDTDPTPPCEWPIDIDPTGPIGSSAPSSTPQPVLPASVLPDAAGSSTPTVAPPSEWPIDTEPTPPSEWPIDVDPTVDPQGSSAPSSTSQPVLPAPVLADAARCSSAPKPAGPAHQPLPRAVSDNTVTIASPTVAPPSEWPIDSDPTPTVAPPSEWPIDTDPLPTEATPSEWPIDPPDNGNSTAPPPAIPTTYALVPPLSPAEAAGEGMSDPPVRTNGTTYMSTSTTSTTGNPTPTPTGTATATPQQFTGAAVKRDHHFYAGVAVLAMAFAAGAGAGVIV